MPDISLSGLAFYPFADGDQPTGDQVSEVAFYARATPDTLEVVNGRLTEANRGAALDPIPAELIRQGHLVDGKQVSASMNHDVYGFLFPAIKQVSSSGYVDAGLVDDDYFDEAAIPVLGQEFYVHPGTKYVRVHWNIGIIHQGSVRAVAGTWASDRGDYFARWRLFVDDTAIRQVTRDIRDSLFILTSDKDNASPVFGGGTDARPDSRWWTGSYIIENPSAGWHSASIRYAAVFADGYNSVNANYQGRVRARRMGYTARK